MKKYKKIIILPILCAIFIGSCKQSETSVIPNSDNNNAIYACTIDSDSIFTDGRASQLCSDGNGSFYAVWTGEQNQNYFVKIVDNKTEIICDLSKDYDAAGICSLNVTDSGSVAMLFYDNDMNYYFLLSDPEFKNYEKYYIENSGFSGNYNVRCEYFHGKFFIYNDFHIYAYTIDDIPKFCGQIETEWSIDKLICGSDNCLYAMIRNEPVSIDIDEIKLGDPIKLSSDIICHNFVTGHGEYMIYAADNKNIYGIKTNGELCIIADLSEWGYSGEIFYNAVTDDDGSISFFENEDNEIFFSHLDLVPINEYEQRVKITVTAISNAENTFENAVRAFNKKSKEFYVEFDYIDQNEQYDLIDQLDKKIISGEALGDILIIPDGVKNAYTSGLFEDLYKYIDDDNTLSRDDLFAPVLSAMETNGHLYGIFANFYIDTYAANTEFYEKYQTFDITEIINDKIQNDLFVSSVSTQTDFIRSLVKINFDSFVNYDKMQCDFDNEKMRLLLDFSRSVNISADDTEENLFTVQPLTIKSVYDMTAAEDMYGLYPVGMPRINGDTLNIIGGDPIYLNSASENKSAAWDLIKFYLNYDQYYPKPLASIGIPVIKKLFYDNMEKHMDNNKRIKENDGINAVEYYFDGKPVKLVEQEDYDALIKLIENSNNFPCDDDILDIVSEEADMYFAGNSTEDDTIEKIQGRANICFTEKN